MKVSTFFGYKCPKCNSKITVGLSIGAETIECPNCHTLMVSDEEGQASAGNVYCPQCKAGFGLVLSDKCPTCGGPFSKMP